jgi:hypothetical protein
MQLRRYEEGQNGLCGQGAGALGERLSVGEVRKVGTGSLQRHGGPTLCEDSSGDQAGVC